MDKSHNKPRNWTGFTVDDPARKKDNAFNFGTYNVRTLNQPGDTINLAREMKAYKMDLVALQEVRWKKHGTHSMKTEGCTLYYSGHQSQALHGTGFLVGRRLQSAIMQFTPINERLCSIRIRGRFYNISVICVYAPTLDKSVEVKDAFYAALENLIQSLPKNDAIMLLGDFNAQIGRNPTYDRYIGRHSYHAASNDNGYRLSDFAISNGLVVASTYFKRKPIHTVTWNSPAGISTQIDHVLISARHFSSIHKIRTYRGADVGSDHYLVGCKCRWKISKQFGKANPIKASFNTDALKDDSIRDSYQDRVETCLGSASSEVLTLNQRWEKIKKSVEISATEVLGRRKPRTHRPWFDDECQQAVDYRKLMYQRFLKKRNRTRAERKLLSDARRAANKICRQKKRIWWERRIEDIEAAGAEHKHRDFYREVNFLKKGAQPSSSAVKDDSGELQTELGQILDAWAKYFDKLLNSGDTTPSGDRSGRRLRDRTMDTTVADPTFIEFRSALQSLKNNKSPGADGISAELLKAGGDRLETELYDLVLQIWRTEIMPSDWNLGVLVPIHKKGDRLNRNNYRGITLLSSAYKTFSNILRARLASCAEDIIGECQSGFRTGRSTTDQIFTLRMILSKFHDKRQPVHQLYIDFRAAYDSLHREELWNSLLELKVPRKLIRLCRMTVENSVCRVRVEGKLSDEFQITSGVRQGDGLSTVLFNLALEGVFRKSEIAQNDLLFKKSAQVLAYADDICVLGRKASAVIKTFVSLEDRAGRIGLEVNSDKTKYVVTGGSRRIDRGLDCGGVSFDRVDSFKYLGSVMNSENKVSDDVGARISAGGRAFQSLRHLFRSPHLSSSSKIRLYESMVRPVVTYGCESWTLTNEDERRLSVSERRVLRSIYGGVRMVDGSYRARYNDELYDLYKRPSILAVVKARRVEWLGHVRRRKDTKRMIWRSYDTSLDLPSCRGRPRLGWREDVLDDLRKVGCSAGWWNRVHDRANWKSVVNKVKLHKWSGA